MGKNKLTIEIVGQGFFHLKYNEITVLPICQDDKYIFVIESDEKIAGEIEIVHTSSYKTTFLSSIIKKADTFSETKRKESIDVLSNYWKHGYLRQKYSIDSSKNSKVKLFFSYNTEQVAKSIFVSYPIMTVDSDRNNAIKNIESCNIFPSKIAELCFYMARSIPAVFSTIILLLSIVLWLYWCFFNADGSLYMYEGEIIFTSFFWRNIVAPIGMILLIGGGTIYQWGLFEKQIKFFREVQGKKGP